MNHAGWLVCALVAGLIRPVFAASNLRISPPKGWLNLSPGAPKENFTKVSENTATFFKDPKVIAGAVDNEAKTGDSGANLVAETIKTAFPISESSVKEFAKDMSESMAKSTKRETKVAKTGIMPIAGVPCGRFVIESKTKLGTPVTQVVYVLPDGTNMVAMYFIITTVHFKKNEADFDKFARTVTGVRAQPHADRMASGSFSPVAPRRLLTELPQFEAADEPQAIVTCGAGATAARAIARPDLMVPRSRAAVSAD
jgi:hypothetical protein